MVVEMINQKIIAELDTTQLSDTECVVVSLKEFNEALDKARASGMNAGVVVALDCVAGYDDVLFKEIVESSGEKEVLKEIMKNGLAKTKETAKSIFPKYKFDRCLNE